jgi:hypothetical protein
MFNRGTICFVIFTLSITSRHLVAKALKLHHINRRYLAGNNMAERGGKRYV